jgi:hypothetical protein
LVATAALLSLPAQAGERYLVTSEEIGVGPPPERYTWIPFRRSEGPADNFYHGAWYAGQPTALSAAAPTDRIIDTPLTARCRGPISARSD